MWRCYNFFLILNNMKNIIILIVALFASDLFGQTNWTQINSNTNNNLQDIIFTSYNIGYIVGDNGTVLKTNDSGNNWSSVFTDSTQSFISTSFVNDSVGYILTSEKLFKTADGGSTWQLKYTYTNSFLNVVWFVSDSIGFIGTDSGILKTIDGGINWLLVQSTPHMIKSIYFTNSEIGYFVGGTDSSDNIYKTINQGVNFTVDALFMQSIKERVFFINNEIGFIIGWYSPYIKKTTDGGLTWIDLYQSFDNSLGGIEINFINEQNGFYVDNSGGQYNLFSTTNSGQTWTNEINIISNSNYSISKISTKFNNGLIIGDNGLIYKKDNLLSINEVKKNVNIIEIFPNPTSEEINIEYNPINVKIKSINLIDETGKIIERIKSDFKKLRLQNISQGTYFLNFITEKGIITKKIIRK
jgi:photosystem II stability/assembly factor-like uncharacterized protein